MIRLLLICALLVSGCKGKTFTEPPDEKSSVQDSTGTIVVIFCVDTCAT
jgi:hypothetical protein